MAAWEVGLDEFGSLKLSVGQDLSSGYVPKSPARGSFRSASIFTSWHCLSEWEGDSGGGDVGMGVDEHNVILVKSV